MKIWERLFGRNNKKVAEAETPALYNYGLDQIDNFLMSRDYGWTEPDESHKKVILTNPNACKEKISLMGMVSAWRGTGHGEWEAILGGWFVQAVIEAIENDAEEADITHLFNRDFLASRDRVFTKQQVYDHLIKWFDIVEETEDTLKLRIHI